MGMGMHMALLNHLLGGGVMMGGMGGLGGLGGMMGGGGAGGDAVPADLLTQLLHAYDPGTRPAGKTAISSLPEVPIGEKEVADKVACSVCM